MTSSTIGRLTLLLWLATSLVSGAIIMSLEMVAFRLYAPYFGYSIYVWGSMISVVLAALAIGYALGGYLADRSRSDLPLFFLVLFSAAYQLVIVMTARSILPPLAERGEASGTAWATLIVFAPPMIALATVSPFLVRLLARAGRVGLAAGTVYALSTVGSIAGILATTFLLIPSVGTQATMAAACFASAIMATIGLARRWRLAPVLLLPLLVLPLAPSARWSTDTVWVTESEYNLVRVRRRGSWVALVLNRDDLIHSARNRAAHWTHQVFDDFALGPLLVPTKQVLVLGMGGGSSILATRMAAPGAEIDAVEIDPAVVEAAARFFEVRPDPSLRIHVADARPWLARSGGRYDVVQVDLYHGGPFMPFYLATVDFFRQARAKMSRDALLIMNVLDESEALELAGPIAATLRRVFPSIFRLTKGNGSHLLLAFTRETSAEDVRRRLQSVREPDALVELIGRVGPEIEPVEPSPGTMVFTDDHAPIERITRRMLARSAKRVEEPVAREGSGRLRRSDENEVGNELISNTGV